MFGAPQMVNAQADQCLASTTVTSNTTVQATNSITAPCDAQSGYYTINSGVSVTFTAPSFIKLEKGFHALPVRLPTE